LIGFVEKEGF